MTRGFVSSYDEDAPLPGVGSVWVWELDEPHARELIEVVEVFWNGEEWWVRARTLPTGVAFSEPVPVGEVHLNDVSRFWEACTPVRETRTPRPPLGCHS